MTQIEIVAQVGPQGLQGPAGFDGAPGLDALNSAFAQNLPLTKYKLSKAGKKYLEDSGAEITVDLQGVLKPHHVAILNNVNMPTKFVTPMNDTVVNTVKEQSIPSYGADEFWDRVNWGKQLPLFNQSVKVYNGPCNIGLFTPTVAALGGQGLQGTLEYINELYKAAGDSKPFKNGGLNLHFATNMKEVLDTDLAGTSDADMMGEFLGQDCEILIGGFLSTGVREKAKYLKEKGHNEVVLMCQGDNASTYTADDLTNNVDYNDAIVQLLPSKKIQAELTGAKLAEAGITDVVGVVYTKKWVDGTSATEQPANRFFKDVYDNIIATLREKSTISVTHDMAEIPDMIIQASDKDRIYQEIKNKLELAVAKPGSKVAIVLSSKGMMMEMGVDMTMDLPMDMMMKMKMGVMRGFYTENKDYLIANNIQVVTTSDDISPIDVSGSWYVSEDDVKAAERRLTLSNDTLKVVGSEYADTEDNVWTPENVARVDSFVCAVIAMARSLQDKSKSVKQHLFDELTSPPGENDKVYSLTTTNLTRYLDRLSSGENVRLASLGFAPGSMTKSDTGYHSAGQNYQYVSTGQTYAHDSVLM